MRLDRYVRRAAACLCTLTLLLTTSARSFGMEAAAESPAPPVFGSVRTEVMDSTSLFGPGRLTMLANHGFTCEASGVPVGQDLSIWMLRKDMKNAAAASCSPESCEGCSGGCAG